MLTSLLSIRPQSLMIQSSPSVRLQAARRPALESLWTLLLEASGNGGRTHSRDHDSGTHLTKARLRTLLEDGTVIAAWRADELAGFVAIDLDRGQLHGPVISRAGRRSDADRRLLVGGERLAATFQRFELIAQENPETSTLLARHGYRALRASDTVDVKGGSGKPLLFRRFRRRQTRYGRRISAVAKELGIPGDYGSRFRLPLQPEATSLAEVGTDIYERPQRLTPAASAAWSRMQAAARDDGIRLDIVSAYRSVDYQAGLLRKKIERGLTMDEILRVSAAPGFSEHHSGRALDLTTPGAPVLESEFEETDAFNWLSTHAAEHGFHLSYPRDNRHGVLFEPWHWCYAPDRSPGQA